MPTPANPSHLQQKILDYLDTTGETVAALEKAAGLSLNGARNILRGTSKRPTGPTLQALAKVMGCSVGELLGAPIPRKTQTHSALHSKELLVAHPKILQEALETLLKMAEKNGIQLQIKQIMSNLEEIYTYSLKKTPPQVDPDFVAWVLEYKVSGER